MITLCFGVSYAKASLAHGLSYEGEFLSRHALLGDAPPLQ